MEEIKDIYLPKWASRLYGVMAIALIPWIIYLAAYLPSKHLARNWDPLWVGFDIMELFAILLTLYYIIKNKIWVIVSASALASIFIVDAWFDILTARPGKEQTEAIILGVVEVTLSLLTFRMVYHVIHQSGRNRNVSLRPKKH
jgi:hypothetical protein